jgi:hypothetical protein
MIKRSLKVLAIAGLAVFGLGACGSSTQFTDIWKAPDAGQIHAKKLLAVFLTSEEGKRRVAEDEMVQHVSKNVQAVQSYKLLNMDQVRDLEFAKQKVKDEGFDVAVTMRLVGVDEKTTYVPGTVVASPYGAAYGSYWGYSGYAWGAVYQPGYTETTRYVMVETNIYSIDQDKLLWSGRSHTADPESAQQLVREVASEARNVLIAQDMIPKK